jgi:hypothetical protein
MGSIFNSADNQQILNRINNLKPGATPLWGTMTVSQMLAHLQMPILVAFGEHKLQRGLVGLLFGKMAKKSMLKAAAFKTNLPTVKSFKMTGDKNFEEEKNKLIRLIERFEKEGGQSITKDPHPFFGKLTIDEWDILQWKHLDHHLRQFGV